MNHFVPVTTRKLAGILLPFLFAGAGILGACKSGNASSWSREQYRAAASALYQQELYSEALRLYQAYLHSDAITPEDMPKVLYQIGNIQLDHLNDPQAALGSYTVLKALFPEITFNNQLGKKIVACLEKSGRRIDAKQALTALTDIKPSKRDTAGGSKIVAEIDDKKISLREVEQSLGALPEAPLERNQVINQYVAQILISEAALRKGIADRPEVKKRLQFMRNQVLAQESLKEELVAPQPSENDLKYYYEAHKARYAKGPDSLADFKTLMPKVARDWQMEKQNEKYQSYIKALLSSDRVKIYGETGTP